METYQTLTTIHTYKHKCESANGITKINKATSGGSEQTCKQTFYFFIQLNKGDSIAPGSKFIKLSLVAMKRDSQASNFAGFLRV